MTTQKMIRKSRFISVEIAIKTNFDSDAFVKWFEAQDEYVDNQSSEEAKWYIYFAPIPYKDANTTIMNLCEMIKNLPDEVSEAWEKAEHREFYAGYEVGDTPHFFPEHIELETLKACVSIGAGIGFCLYPASPTNEHGLHPGAYEINQTQTIC